MTNIFNHLSITSWLNELLDTPINGKKYTLSHLANAMGIKSPYVSKCLHGKAALNLDQLYLLGKELKLGDDELDFCLLLGEHERTYYWEKKEYLAKKIKTRQQQYLKDQLQTDRVLTTTQLNISFEDQLRYYQAPLNLLVHLLLNLNSPQEKFAQFCQQQGISKKEFDQVVDLLEELHIVKKEKNDIILLKRNLHLPQGAPLCYVHQQLMRQYILNYHLKQQVKQQHTSAAHHIDQISPYHLLMTFSADPMAMQQIKIILLEAVERIGNVIDNAPSDSLYQMQIELFSWI